jgi:hypothetical protein
MKLGQGLRIDRHEGANCQRNDFTVVEGPPQFVEASRSNLRAFKLSICS